MNTLPKMGRPAKPRAVATGFLGEPLPVGAVVRNKAVRVLRVEEKRICPGGPLRYFYELEGSTGANVLFDYFKIAGGVCNPT